MNQALCVLAFALGAMGKVLSLHRFGEYGRRENAQKDSQHHTGTAGL